MEVRVQGKCGPVVNNVDDACSGKYSQQLQDQQGQWVAQLRVLPTGRNSPIWKRRFIETFQELADQVVAGVLAQATAADDFAQDTQKK